MTLSATELYRRGRAHLNAGQNASARRALARASERTDDPDLRARIAGSLAALVIRQGDPAAAERLCREALESPHLRAETLAMLYGQLGLLALERGDLKVSIEWLDRGIAGADDDPDGRAPMLINRSVAHMQAGDLAQARADLERAAADYAATGDDIDRAMAVHNAGYASLLEGDLVLALDTMAEAYPVLAAASAVNAAICDLDRAEVLRDAGLATDAERSLDRVAHVFGAHRMTQARGEAEFHLARSLLTHSPGRAIDVASIAARRFRRLGSDWWALRADAVRLRANLAACTIELNRPAEGISRVASRTPDPSEAEILRVITSLGERGLRTDAFALRFAGELWLAAHNLDSPERSGAIRTPSDAPIQVRLMAHEVRAARAAAAGSGSRARRHAAAGLDALADWQASFGSLDLATALVMHGDGLIYAGLNSAVRSRRPELIFEWSERARHLSQQVVPLRPPPDPELAADLAELRQLRGDVDGAGGAGDWLASQRAIELSERVRRRQWSATGAAGRRARMSLEELCAELQDDTAFVTYVFDGVGLVALAVGAGGPQVIPIVAWPTIVKAMAGLRADLDVAASLRTGPMAAVVRRTLEDRLAVLSDSLVAPVASTIGDRPTAITVPSILGGIPWAMLPAMRGRVFTVATSATQWVAERGGAAASDIGFVVGPNVARGQEEVALATRAWDGAKRHSESLQGPAATVDHATSLAARVGVLHVAAHGRHSSDHPLFSGLHLADGALFGYDIDLMTRVPHTVVLSACELGRSSVRWGHEAIGMTRIWLHAGSRCVIAAPVIVADDVACELLGAMHEGLAAGEAPSVALAAASERTGIVAPFQAHGAGF